MIFVFSAFKASAQNDCNAYVKEHNYESYVNKSYPLENQTELNEKYAKDKKGIYCVGQRRFINNTNRYKQKGLRRMQRVPYGLQELKLYLDIEDVGTVFQRLENKNNLFYKDFKAFLSTDCDSKEFKYSNENIIYLIGYYLAKYYDPRVEDKSNQKSLRLYKDFLTIKNLYADNFIAIDEYSNEFTMHEDLMLIAGIETGFENKKENKAGAAGLWQFIESTALENGLFVHTKNDSMMDDRLNIGKSTGAAAKFLRKLYLKLRSWPLVIMAYNTGETGLKNVLKSIGLEDKQGYKNISSEDAVILIEKVPSETREYLWHFIALAYVFDVIETGDLPAFD